MRKTKNNKMLMHGFILVTILATAKSAEAEITMEAAFQGHCGHTSPCEQLCYEIHDGMYECDCIEGYELNKNGYSCQVINGTSNSDGHSKSDEDVLYQKGASFSAKLANGNERDNQLSSSYSSASAASASSASSSLEDINDEDMDDAEVANFFADDMQRLAQRSKVNSNDYYISAESINFNNEQQEQELTNTSQDVPEFKAAPAALVPSPSGRHSTVAATTTATATATGDFTDLHTGRKTIRINLKAQRHVGPTTTTTGAPALAEDNYYAKQDMSIYDDVNNNQLNLRPLSQSTYQNRYAASAADSKPMSISKDNQKQNRNAVTGATGAAGGSATAYNAAISANVNISNMNGGVAAPMSDFCSLDCGADGVCDRSEGSSRCLCPFGKSGSSCMEDVKVRTPKFSKYSWLAFPALRGAYKHVQVRVEFRPESFNGIILLSGERDDLTGDFMALLLNKGFVEFWFDCGSGVGSVRSRETILLNEWNSVIIYRHRWDAWLVLNHGTKVQGRSNGLFSRITFREPVFLGGTGNITGLTKRLPIYNGFAGCIRRFVANEHEYRFEEHPLGDVTKGFDIQDCVTDKCFKYPCQHGGKCLPSDQGAVCLCPIGFVGDLCEIRMDLQVPAFNGSSYLRYAPLGDSALIWLELKVILKPEQPDGLVLYSGPEKHGDFIALSLSGGYVEFVFDLGSGPAVVRSEYPVSIGQWHTIKVSRTARLAVLKVDQYAEVMTISSNGFWHLSLPANLFVGGVSHVDKLPLDLKSKPFFVGCIQKIDINGHALAIISEALGGSNIGNCPHACVARPCGPLAECVPQMESYECRCSAFSAQCNKAGEVPPEELEKNKAKSKHKANQHDRLAAGHEVRDKKKKTKAHKQQKLHISKERARYAHKRTQPAWTYTDTPTASVSTATTVASTHFALAADNGVAVALRQGGGRAVEANIEDDIIFRDEHGMHRKYGHNEQAQRNKNNSNKNNNTNSKRNNNNHGKPKTQQKATADTNTNSKTNTQTNTATNGSQRQDDYASLQHQGKGQARSHGSSIKHDPYNKHAGFSKYKLSSLPTHYESFQTNPDSDILTFDDSVNAALDADVFGEQYKDDSSGAADDGDGDSDGEEYADADDDADVQYVLEEQDERHAAPQSNNAKYAESAYGRGYGNEHEHDAMNEETKSEPYVIDGTLFDANDGAEEYHRKQLAQDMRRIMANAHDESATEKRPKLVVDEYDYEADELGEEIDDKVLDYAHSLAQSELSPDSTDTDTDSDSDRDSDDDDEDTDDDLLEPVQSVAVQPVSAAKMKLTTTPQTHTDWSLLKKLELSADHQSQFAGVRKNFGACFAGDDSYFHYNDAETMSQIISYNIDLNLRIKTHSPNGVILWTGRQGTTDEDDDYLSLGIENGYLHFRYDLGSGEVDIKFNTTKVSDGLWHRVRAIRDSQAGYLEVDGRKTLTHYSPGKLRQLNTDTGLYVGGMPDVSYFTRRKYASGIVGCISEIVLAGELKLNFDPNTLGTAHNVETGLL